MEKIQKIVVTGGTGFVGRKLCALLSNKNYEVVVLSRSTERAKKIFGEKVSAVLWDGKTHAPLVDLLQENTAIVNLIGENIGSGRWTSKKLSKIINSRVDAGNAITTAIEKSQTKPAALIQASGIGYYGNQHDKILDENSTQNPSTLTDIATQWEKSVEKVTSMGVRLAIFRLGVVLGKDGGFLSRVVLPFKFFMGGHQGSGEQWISWIHINDVIYAILYLIENEKLEGVFNLSSENPVQAREFYRHLGKVLNRPSWLPVPGFAMRLLLGEMADELILSGQRAMPKRLLENGYQFDFSDLKQALTDLMESD